MTNAIAEGNVGTKEAIYLYGVVALARRTRKREINAGGRHMACMVRRRKACWQRSNALTESANTSIPGRPTQSA